MDKIKSEEHDPSNEARTQEDSFPNQKQETVMSAKADYQKLSDELSSYKEKYLRLMAEFENARKRMDREKQEFVKFANEGLIVDFLNVLDDLERSVEAAKAKHEDYTAFLKGIEMVMAHIYDLLKRNGVKSIKAKGTKFDPHCHEVLMQEESDGVEDGIVLDELQKGYYLGDRVVRTAKVKLSKKKEN